MAGERIIRVQENQEFDLIPEGSVLSTSYLHDNPNIRRSFMEKYGIKTWTVVAPRIILESEYGLIKLRHAETTGLGYGVAGVALNPFDPNVRFNNEDISLDGRAGKLKRNVSKGRLKSDTPTLSVETYNEDFDFEEKQRVLSPNDLLDKKILARLRLQVGFPDITYEALPEPLFMKVDDGIDAKIRLFSFYPLDTGSLSTDTDDVLFSGYHFTLPHDKPIPLVRGRFYFAD